jgi:YD repeat-containing protein
MKTNTLSFFFLLSIYSSSLWAQSTDMNYIRTRTLRLPVKDAAVLDQMPNSAIMEDVHYFDGLGRLIQTVQVQAAPSGNTLYIGQEYNEYGEIERQYLPFTDPSLTQQHNGEYLAAWKTSQDDFYHQYDRIPISDYPYAETKTEDSPLRRVLRTAAPGEAWRMNQGANIRYQYELNDAGDNVRYWTVSFAGSTPSLETMTINGFFGFTAYELFKTTTIDENGVPSVVYKRKDGKVVKKTSGFDTKPETFLETHYVYDRLGRLAAVIPPKAFELMKAHMIYQVGPLDMSNEIQELIYRYIYDEAGRLIEKKIPGAAPVYFVYDPYDRLIFQQDGNLRASQEWIITKYDRLNRVIMTGITNSLTRVQVQNHVNNESVFFEVPDDSGPHGYSDLSYPGLIKKVLHVDYYDGNPYALDHDQDGTDDVDFIALAPFDDAPTSRLSGLTTASKVLILDGSVAPTYQWTHNFYDDKGQIIQTWKSNYPGGFDRTFVQYNFSGLPIRSRVENTIEYQSGNIESHVIEKRMTYDHMNRPISIFNSIDGQSEKELVKITYNELGQISEKGLLSKHPALPVEGTNPDLSFLQSVDYSYNIRGWLTHINNCDLSNNDPTNYSSGGGSGFNGGGLELGRLIGEKPGGNVAEEVGPGSGSIKLPVDPEPGDPDDPDDPDDPRDPEEPEDPDPVLTPFIEQIINDDDHDIWGICFDYEEGFGKLQGDRAFNGNIAGARWQSISDSQIKGYGYQYDALNRLKQAKYAEKNPNTKNFSKNIDRYSVRQIEYDLNGNIMHLRRDGAVDPGSAAFGMIDRLYYTYFGNRLQKVLDQASPLHHTNDFIDGVNLNTEYGYDDNGNMITDLNKGISVTYNFLNLPRTIQFTNLPSGINQSIEYIYSAEGVKLAKNVDPLAHKFPNISPYAFVENNPINLIDPDGREPIKPFAGTVSGFMTFFNGLSSGIGSSTGSTAHAAMLRMGSVNWSMKGPSPAATAPFNTSGGNRYIYTKKGGWIDMSHFMFYAGRGYQAKLDKQQAQSLIKGMREAGVPYSEIPKNLISTSMSDPVGEAVQEGYMQEKMDQYGPTYSAYSYEDLPSDKFGADFSVNYFDPNSESSFGEQLQNYLNNVLGATNPENAPNYENLPTEYPVKGELPSVQNRTTEPMFIKE